MSVDPSKPVPATLRWRLFPAIAIIAIGALFLANNLGYNLRLFEHGNWWAVIILAAAAPLTRAFDVYRAGGWTPRVPAPCCARRAWSVVLVGVRDPRRLAHAGAVSPPLPSVRSVQLTTTDTAATTTN